MCEQKEREFVYLLNNKDRDKGKNKFLWNDNRGVVSYANQEFDLNLLDSYIHKNFKEQYKQTLEEVTKQKSKKMMLVWEKCINDNLDLNQNIQNFYNSQYGNVFIFKESSKLCDFKFYLVFSDMKHKKKKKDQKEEKDNMENEIYEKYEKEVKEEKEKKGQNEKKGIIEEKSENDDIIKPQNELAGKSPESTPKNKQLKKKTPQDFSEDEELSNKYAEYEKEMDENKKIDQNNPQNELAEKSPRESTPKNKQQKNKTPKDFSEDEELSNKYAEYEKEINENKKIDQNIQLHDFDNESPLKNDLKKEDLQNELPKKQKDDMESLSKKLNFDNNEVMSDYYQDPKVEEIEEEKKEEESPIKTEQLWNNMENVL